MRIADNGHSIAWFSGEMDGNDLHRKMGSELHARCGVSGEDGRSDRSSVASGNRNRSSR
jgi:hypothetical protein